MNEKIAGQEELGVALKDASALKFSHAYVWQSDFETEHIKTYLYSYDGSFKLQAEEVEDGKFWTMEEMRQAKGTGVLTPNLELEMGFLS
jgi:hypothetical protein